MQDYPNNVIYSYLDWDYMHVSPQHHVTDRIELSVLLTL